MSALFPTIHPIHETPGVLRHVSRLTGFFPDGARRIAFVRVYAKLHSATPTEALHCLEPELEVYPADDQGFEGVACVDDVARAAVLALQVYEMTHSAVALDLACAWLRFVKYMQGERDQRMINFILDEQGTRNGNGKTSYPGGEPWTLRALQAYATAWRVLRDGDFLDRFWRTPFPPTGNLKYAAVYALSLTDVYQTEPDRGLEQWITDTCDMLVGSGPEYLRDACGKGEVEIYSYYQLAAVARAGRLLNKHEYLKAAVDTARNLAKPVIEGGFYHVYPGARGPQSVFDVSALGLGLEELYYATEDGQYQDMALQCAAWLDGANPAGVAIYDPETGRCNDKVFVSGEVDSKVGAESAIEAGFLHLLRSRLSGVRTGIDVDSGSMTPDEMSSVAAG
ncbi:MAG TPA: hypothetical protein VHR15_16130 [Ktedonobacterales bacterium]|jgi:hypothetical protein|nr:hypothetical protein [Ktedonobacterales bacterium]